MPTHDHQTDDTSLKLLRRTVLKSTVAGAGLAVLGGRAAGQEDPPEDEDEGEGEAIAEVVVETQVTDGSTVEIESVTVPDGGFVSLVDPVAAHDELPLETMPRLDDVIAVQVQGASEFLEPGTHENVVIEFDEPLEAEQLYQVWVHQDTGDDETLSYVESAGEEDSPYPLEFDPTADDEEENGEDDEEENGEEEETEALAETIELEGVVSGWIGLAPAEIEGETNPTLTLEAGTTYEVTWVNGDGQSHNFVIVDGDDNRLVSTDLMGEEGETQTVDFEATAEMVEYFCDPHRNSMIGDVEIVGTDGEEEENGEEEEENGEDEENGEEENGEGEQPEEMHPTQVPNIVMGDVYLHLLPEGIERQE